MKSLYDFIKVTINEAKDDIKDQRKELLNMLKGSYPDYIEKLNEMVEDPKSKALIDDAFGGELGDMKLKMSMRTIPANVLMPTQNEIDTSKSLDRSLNPSADLSALFAKVITLGFPLVTFNGSWIIDGHHRWSQVACYNPEGKMMCIDFKGNASPIQILKAVQGAIAAAEGDIPSNKVTGLNIYDMNEKKARQYFEERVNEPVFENLHKWIRGPQDIKGMVDHLTDNVMSLINDHPLMNYAPERGLMPQTDKSKGGDISNPDSALHILANDKVLKVPGNR